jgi:hypothetical protein
MFGRGWERGRMKPRLIPGQKLRRSCFTEPQKLGVGDYHAERHQ